jgi:hypothetical protein
MVACFVCNAQLLENFDDNDFIINPKWMGDTAKFRINNGKLQSNSTTINDKFYLSLPCQRLINTEWNFWINLQFNTSSANYVDIYLTSDSSNLLLSNTGYIIRLGTTNDNISLVKKTKTNFSTLLSSKSGLLNHSSSSFRVKVVYSEKKWFSIWIDSAGMEQNRTFIGEVKDSSNAKLSSFGVAITQSSVGFHAKHFFDNLYIGKIIRDTVKPFIAQCIIQNSDTMVISISEKLKPTSFQLENFEINKAIGYPKICRMIDDDSLTFQLIFNQKLSSNVNYLLAIKQLEDLNGNILADTSLSIKWINYEKPGLFDLVVHEVYPNPLNSNGLPNQEYLEILNNSQKFLTLTNCSISDLNSTAYFKEVVLEPQHLIILCEEGKESLFSGLGRVIGLKNFPNLNNSGDAIQLRNESGGIIHKMQYDLSSYRDKFKENGGWSLEMIDPYNPCHSSNYMASNSALGGTPGKMNAISYNNPDITAPGIKSVAVKGLRQIILTFNEVIDSLSNVDTNQFLLEDHSIESVICNDQIILINIKEALEENKIYTLKIKAIADCTGNKLEDTVIQVACPIAALPNDLIINEILFNPPQGGADFVEIYNRSQNIISLKGLQFFNLDENKLPKDLIKIDTTGIYMLPNQYLCFSTNPEWLVKNYPHSVSQFIKLLMPMVAMYDDMGVIGMAYDQHSIIDQLEYSNDMHYPLITNTEGVSLERIGANIPTSELTNWTSAAASYGFATPGSVNSHSFHLSSHEPWFWIEPDLFSPDEDGIDDLIAFTIASTKLNQQLTLKIFDAQGKLISSLANNIPLGNKQTLFWDGTSSENKKSPIGIYIAYAELFGLDGKRLIKKKTFTLGGK